MHVRIEYLMHTKFSKQNSMGYHAIFKILSAPYPIISSQNAFRQAGCDMLKMTNVSMELLSDILTWLLWDIK